MIDRNRLLEHAIRGLKLELEGLEAELASGARTVGRKVAEAGAGEMGEPIRKRRERRMSDEAKARISAAQKARWANRR
jgi:hypothetical protein